MATYDDLKTAVKGYSNRTDISDADFATFVKTAESRMWRLLRLFDMQQIYQYTVDPVTDGKVNLPTAFIEWKAIYYGDRHLEQMTIEQYITEKNQPDSSAKFESKPAFYVRYPQSIYVWPLPTETGTGDAIYYARPVAITPEVPTSDLFDKLYDCYLWGCLEQTYIRYGYDERAPLMMQKFEQAIMEVQNLDKRQEYSGGIQRTNPRKMIYTGY